MDEFLQSLNIPDTLTESVWINVCLLVVVALLVRYTIRRIGKVICGEHTELGLKILKALEYESKWVLGRGDRNILYREEPNDTGYRLDINPLVFVAKNGSWTDIYKEGLISSRDVRSILRAARKLRMKIQKAGSIGKAKQLADSIKV